MQQPGGTQIFPPAATFVAHQGGWDEILMVAGPLAIIGLLLYIANRRVNAQLESASPKPTSDGSSPAKNE